MIAIHCLHCIDFMNSTKQIMNRTFVSTYFGEGFTELLKVNGILFAGFVLSDSFQKTLVPVFQSMRR